MPIELGLWRVDGGAVRAIASSRPANEAQLEAILAGDLTILGLDVLLPVGRQVPTDFGKRIDILALDAAGDVYVIELKRDRTPREVVAQALDYGSWVGSLDGERLAAIYAERNGGASLEARFAELVSEDVPPLPSGEHHLIIVASELDASTERIVSYLSDFGVPVNVVFFKYFRDGDAEYLARSWLVDPAEAETRARPTRGGRREVWNGQDYYVSLGENEVRQWEDCRRYGFVSAGGGPWYSRTLAMLTPGARVFACIPKVGYVGVGTVTETVKPVTEFTVNVGGEEVPVLTAPLTASNVGRAAEDPERCEYFVRIEWVETVAREDALWEKGMFANQNSACRLRSSFTIERLTDLFGLNGQDEA